MQRRFKIFLTLLAVIGLVGFSSEKQSEETDEKALRKIVQSYEEAYNQQDAAKLTENWVSDATYINPVTGEVAEGKEAIEKLFKEKFAQGKKRYLEVKINSIEFPDEDEAIERGTMKVSVGDQKAQKIAYQARYVKENGQWRIKAMNEIELQEASFNFEKLKDLSWMVGKWEDSDENVDILFDNQWDTHKNFIIQNFKMKIYGQDDLEGKQVIAWDPVKEVIRSWVFDSDGEFGEGTWEKGEKSWYATMRYTLSDGRVGSSINIYTPVNDRSYTFASEEREVDGEVLPDINPVTVNKVE